MNYNIMENNGPNWAKEVRYPNDTPTTLKKPRGTVIFGGKNAPFTLIPERNKRSPLSPMIPSSPKEELEHEGSYRYRNTYKLFIYG